MLHKFHFIIIFASAGLLALSSWGSVEMEAAQYDGISDSMLLPSLYSDIHTFAVEKSNLVSSTRMETKEPVGLGMFSPDYFENTSLYFYGKPYTGNAVEELAPYDSITFSKSEFGAIDIATAPLWLVPQHLKMDYGILLFKVLSVTREFIEIIVNTSTGQTAFVKRDSGDISYWPDFLLNAHSVEFIHPDEGIVYGKPLDHAGTVSTKFSFMKALRVSEEWMYVELQNDDFQKVGHGWIKWFKDDQLTINYSLLS